MKKINNSGQGLVELIVSIAIIEIGLFSVWSLFLVNFNAVREAQMRIVGVNLAREGIEVIKNIRDTNWLKTGNNIYSNPPVNSVIWTWDENLIAGDYSVNYDSADLEAISGGNDQLYLNDSGLYSNIHGESAKPIEYKRKITLTDICCTDNIPHDFQCDDSTYEIVSDGCSSDKLKIGINVVAEVSWQLSGHDRRAVLEDNLYNWK